MSLLKISLCTGLYTLEAARLLEALLVLHDTPAHNLNIGDSADGTIFSMFHIPHVLPLRDLARGDEKGQETIGASYEKDLVESFKEAGLIRDDAWLTMYPREDRRKLYDNFTEVIMRTYYDTRHEMLLKKALKDIPDLLSRRDSILKMGTLPPAKTVSLNVDFDSTGEVILWCLADDQALTSRDKQILFGISKAVDLSIAAQECAMLLEKYAGEERVVVGWDTVSNIWSAVNEQPFTSRYTRALVPSFNPGCPLKAEVGLDGNLLCMSTKTKCTVSARGFKKLAQHFKAQAIYDHSKILEENRDLVGESFVDPIAGAVMEDFAKQAVSQISTASLAERVEMRDFALREAYETYLTKES